MPVARYFFIVGEVSLGLAPWKDAYLRSRQENSRPRFSRGPHSYSLKSEMAGADRLRHQPPDHRSREEREYRCRCEDLPGERQGHPGHGAGAGGICATGAIGAEKGGTEATTQTQICKVSHGADVPVSAAAAIWLVWPQLLVSGAEWRPCSCLGGRHDADVSLTKNRGSPRSGEASRRKTTISQQEGA